MINYCECNSHRTSTKSLRNTPTPQHSFFYTEQVPTHKTRPKSAENRHAANNSNASSKCICSDSRISRSSERSLQSSNSGQSTRSKSPDKTERTITHICHMAKKASKHKSKLSSASVLQLKHDLEAIKNQLYVLTKHKQEALDITNELQERYKVLVSTNQNQQKEIEFLKSVNHSLLSKTNDQNLQEMIEAKRGLEEYQAKLDELYKEFVDSSSVMEQSRNQICRCIKSKSDELKNLSDTKNRLQQENKNKEAKCEEWKRKYKELKHQYDSTLSDSQKVNDLETEVNQLKEQLQNYQKRERDSKLHESELREQNQQFKEQLEEKSKIMVDLSGVVDDLKDKICACSYKVDDLKRLQKKYDDLLVKYKTLVDKFKINEQNDKKKHNETQELIQSMKEREEQLLEDQTNLRRVTAELASILRGNKEDMIKLGCLLQQKEFEIRSLKDELIAKNRQIKLSNENFPKFTNDPNQCAADSSLPNLSQELEELITSLYEEIDNVMVKEQTIRAQFQEICFLRQSLASKDKELHWLRNRMKELGYNMDRTVNDSDNSVDLNDRIGMSKTKKLPQHHIDFALDYESEVDTSDNSDK